VFGVISQCKTLEWLDGIAILSTCYSPNKYIHVSTNYVVVVKYFLRISTTVDNWLLPESRSLTFIRNSMVIMRLCEMLFLIINVYF